MKARRARSPTRGSGADQGVRPTTVYLRLMCFGSARDDRVFPLWAGCRPADATLFFMIRAARRLALTWSVLPFLAFAAAPADPWLRIQSANFELFTTAGERAGRDLVRHFEQVRGFFLGVFGVKSGDRRPVRIVAFHSEKEFAPYRPSE